MSKHIPFTSVFTCFPKWKIAVNFPFHKSVAEFTVSEQSVQMLDVGALPALKTCNNPGNELPLLKIKKKHLTYSDLCIYAHVRSHLSHLKVDYKALFIGKICANCFVLKGP